MYSIVLMMALGNGSALPAAADVPPGKTYRYGNHLAAQAAKHGCKGCCGGCYGCYGCCGGCYGYSCYGCCGGCYGGYSYGCCGGCYGGYSSGCCGGCYGGYSSGCCGGCYGYDAGSYGGQVIYSDGGYSSGADSGTSVAPATGDKPAPAPKKPETLKKPAAPSDTRGPAPATIVVTLPADARLSFNGAATTSTSGTRVFNSPALEPEQTYVYTIKAELVRDGQTVTVAREVKVRAGEETRVQVEFQTATASVVSK